MSLVTIGVGLALPFSWWLGRYIRSELYGVDAADPMTIGTAVVGLMLVAAAASAIPSMRAARISAIRALRQE